MVDGVARWGCVVLSGIEHKPQDIRLVQQGIVDFVGHEQADCNTQTRVVNTSSKVDCSKLSSVVVGI